MQCRLLIFSGLFCKYILFIAKLLLTILSNGTVPIYENQWVIGNVILCTPWNWFMDINIFLNENIPCTCSIKVHNFFFKLDFILLSLSKKKIIQLLFMKNNWGTAQLFIDWRGGNHGFLPALLRRLWFFQAWLGAGDMFFFSVILYLLGNQINMFKPLNRQMQKSHN